MFESFTKKERIISATLSELETTTWQSLTLVEIAQRADLNLSELRSEFSSKSGILEEFSRAIDDEVLRTYRADAGDTVRDRLFDVLMTRFDLLLPYRPVLKRIFDEFGGRFTAPRSPLRHLLGSQYWMLTAAGIDVEGPMGIARLSGAASLYAQAFSRWVEDDDPSQAKSMAFLDRRLRRGEKLLGRLALVQETCSRLGTVLGSRNRGRKGKNMHETPQAAEQSG
ncbi:MAG: TetR/AcrR family transcriptional regulator [Methyloligellaceae bacterium]